MSPSHPKDPFPTTQFTLLEQLHSESEAIRRDASDRLARLYLKPITRFIAHRPNPPGEPEDLAQEFFATVVLSRKLFEGVDPARGKLRALLSVSLKRFLINKHRWSRREPNLGGPDSLPDLGHDPDADALFDNEWYVNIFRQAIRATHEHYTRRNMGHYWEAFERGRLRPSLTTSDRPSNSDLSRELGFEESNLVAVAVHRVKARLRRQIEALVAETAGSEEDQAEELRALASVLASHEAWNQNGNVDLWNASLDPMESVDGDARDADQ